MMNNILGASVAERDQWNREREETNALLESLAAKEVASVEAVQPNWLEMYQADHQKDAKGYSFSCKKHGNFLTVFVTRKSNPIKSKYDWVVSVGQEFSTTLNLSKVRNITTNWGYSPDLNGCLEFGYGMEPSDPANTTKYLASTNWGNYKSPNGHHWVVRIPSCEMPFQRQMLKFDPPPDDRNYISGGEYHIKITVPNAARTAKDDEIRFEGLGATLFAPAGLGKGVHAKILKALEQ